MQVRDKLYINGQWAAPKGNKSIDVINASTEEVMGRIPEGTEADVDAAVAAARAAFDRLGRDTCRSRARRIPAENPRRPESAHGRDRQADRRRSGHAGETRHHDPGGLPHCHLRPVRQDAGQFRLRREGRQFAGPARTGRRGRRDHALELPAAPDRRQGRAGARRRLHRGAQAFRSRAAQRLRAGRDHSRRRPARGRVQPGHRLRPGGGRSAWRGTRMSTWCPSPAPPAPASASPNSPRPR